MLSIRNDFQEFLELNSASTVIINFLDDPLDLLSVLDETESDERVFKLVNSNRFRAVVV